MDKKNSFLKKGIDKKGIDKAEQLEVVSF